jgi:hypothetical protein
MAAAPEPAAAPPLPALPPPAEPPADAVAPEPVVAPAAEPTPAAPEYKVTTGMGLRFGAQFQNLRRPKRLGTFNVDEIYAEPRFSGQVLGFVGWTANLSVVGSTPATAINQTTPPPDGPPILFEARAMDLVAQLDFMDEFHVWGGRMLTPADRSNFSGPWFMSPWDYPGVYSVPGPGGGFAYVGPRGTEEIGREVGTVVWGDIGKGQFKYYGGIMDLDNVPQNTPLYTGRLAYAIFGSEPGFYGSSTYYGGQDILAIGAGAQYQKRFNSGGNVDDVFEFNADVLAEFNVGSAGTLTAEGAYYHVDSGKTPGVMPYDDAFFVVLSYLTPAIGPGKLQPLFRYQQTIGGVDIALPDGSIGEPDKRWIAEGQVSYVLKDYFAKLSVGFQHTDIDHPSGAPKVVANALQLGFQIQQ